MQQSDYLLINENRLPENIFYKDSLVLLEGVIRELTTRIDIMRKLYDIKTGRDPIEHCKARIKSVDSMIQKLHKKNLPQNSDSALKEIHDAAGIRIVCTFVDDVYAIVSEILNQNDLEIIEQKDYIANPKPNGYRSYHIILKSPVHVGADIEHVYAEIQIRTIAMDCWATLEHQMKYKKDIKNAALISQELKRCADEIASTDITMQTIRELINEN